ncbi:prostaglandin reductase 1-like [Homalodisca vitripennis]|uniref:prostaglandin reductase 1-like n=1 Tax=Homalodisca vitripennis TaxID=197043 RepID=UPI001EEA9A5E|nr:prostaglandin reductase 1-like [Homalodisca vitripennis]
MPQNKRYIYVNAFEGLPKLTDFELITEDVPSLQSNEVLCEALYFSVDPYMRAHSNWMTEGQTMIGTQVAKIVESAHDKFPVGSLLFGDFGWQLYTVCNPGVTHSCFDRRSPQLLSDLNHFPASLSLGVLGMPGNLAYCGLLEVCKPETGEVVVVSGAGGAIGSIVGQIAKIKGCKVVGIVGSEEKMAWIQDELGFDAAINYKTSNVAEALQEAVPEGVDCYFDNVGGETSSAVIAQMNMHGRVACCGAIAIYNEDGNLPSKVTPIQLPIIAKELKIEGITGRRFAKRADESFKVLTKWLVEGKLHYKETVYGGFEKLPEALISILKGENLGKAIVRA